jgi:hypothetical protein
MKKITSANKPFHTRNLDGGLQRSNYSITGKMSVFNNCYGGDLTVSITATNWPKKGTILKSDD